MFTLAAGIKVAASAVGTAAAGQLAGLAPTTIILAASLVLLATGLVGIILRPGNPWPSQADAPLHHSEPSK